MTIAIVTVLCLLLSPDFKNNDNYYQQVKNLSAIMEILNRKGNIYF